MKLVYDQFVYMRFKSPSSTITIANIKDRTETAEKRIQILSSHNFDLLYLSVYIIKCVYFKTWSEIYLGKYVIL